jgi:hypothetical protein
LEYKEQITLLEENPDEQIKNSENNLEETNNLLYTK